MARVLVIEDDLATAVEISRELPRFGFTVGHEQTGPEGLNRARTEPWDALVVDRMLPGLDGLSVVGELREGGSRIPTLILSALDNVGERIRGLRSGGDDYLVKPFSIEELAARLDCLMRRPSRAEATVLTAGSLKLDVVRRRAWRGQRELLLLGREFQLLEYMLRRAGQTVTRQMILTDVFGYRFDIKTNLVDVHLGRLRRKLEECGETPLLSNIRGVGFVLNATE